VFKGSFLAQAMNILGQTECSGLTSKTKLFSFFFYDRGHLRTAVESRVTGV